MIQRTYAVRMSSNDSGRGIYPDLDIMPFGPVGTKAAPVAWGNCPVGWDTACGDGIYFEIRGRAVPPIPLYGAANFRPLVRMGWNLTIHGSGIDDSGDIANTRMVPLYGFSNTIISGVLGANVMKVFVDPSYGPVIRLVNNVGTTERHFIVHFNIFDEREETQRRA